MLVVKGGLFPLYRNGFTVFFVSFISSKIKQRKANGTGHILRRNCLLKHVVDGKAEGTGRRERRHKRLLDDLSKQVNTLTWKEKSLNCTLWRTRFGRGCGPVKSRQIGISLTI
jgi:hypothetical protein